MFDVEELTEVFDKLHDFINKTDNIVLGFFQGRRAECPETEGGTFPVVDGGAETFLFVVFLQFIAEKLVLALELLDLHEIALVLVVLV